MKKLVGIIVLILLLAACAPVNPAASTTPVNATPPNASGQTQIAALIYEANKGNGGCPGRTDPLGWYMNGINDGHGWSCLNGTWVESTPIPVAVPAKPPAQVKVASDEIQIWSPTGDKPYSIFVRGTGPVSNSVKGGPTDKPLKFNGNAVAQALYDWGLRNQDEVHYFWVDFEKIQNYCQSSVPACMNYSSGAFTVYISKGPYGGYGKFDNNVDLYNNILQGETYRLIYNKVKGRLDYGGDGLNSDFWKDWGNTPSPYKFVSE